VVVSLVLENNMNIQENVKLNNFTTFKIGGNAHYYVEVRTEVELREVFAWIDEEKLKWVVIAGGSNVLMNSNIFDGVLIRILNNDIIVRGDRIECGAGAILSKALTMAMKESLTGLEWSAGIPGSVGGAIRGNAGSFSCQISDVVEVIEVYNLEKGKMETLSNKDCKFAYRDSVYKEQNSKYIIWKVFLKLKKGDSVEMQGLISKYMEYKIKMQPKLPNAGSIFKNIDADELKEQNLQLYNMAIEQGITIHANGIGAGWIIDKLDLKGKKIGGAKISLEHANFIVNTGEATAEDVVMLVSFIKQKVRDRYKIQLHEEIQYLGF